MTSQSPPEPRFYVDEGYWFEVWDRIGRISPDGSRSKTKAAVVRAGVLYPADDFPTKKSATRYAEKLNKMVAAAAAKGASQEVQDKYWMVLEDTR